MCGLHRDREASPIVDGAGSKVPGIQMTGDDHDLLGMLRSLQISDYVVASYIR